MAKAKDDDVLGELLATPRSNSRKLSWFEKLPEETQAKLLVIRRAFHANEVGGRTIMEIFRFVEEKYSPGVRDGAFKKWLNEVE